MNKTTRIWQQPILSRYYFFCFMISCQLKITRYNLPQELETDSVIRVKSYIFFTEITITFICDLMPSWRSFHEIY